MKTKKYYPGLDILKFIMAILIIAMHTQLFIECPNLFQLTTTIEGYAVPTFFAISSFLFYKSLQNNESNQSSIFKHALFRLVIFYLIWYILMLPMTYETFFKLANFKEILYAITLSSTFAGYWFIKALIINTIIIYVVFKKRKLLPFSIISITIYLLLSYNNIYSFIELPISVYPSFYYNLAYFVVGIFYATVEQKVTSCNIKTTYCVLSCFILIICSFIPFLYPICNLLIPFTLILTANYLFHNNKSYYKLRVMSILFYVLQFLAIHLYNKFIGKFDIDITHNLLGNSLIKFSLITLILFLISHLIIKLEKNKKFSYLKYLH